MRRSASRRTDGKYFQRTASHTKAINLASRVYRGGIRL